MHFYKTRIASLILAGVLAACSETSPPASDSATAMADAADWVLTNGQILTVDEDFSIVEAMAIKDGRILATGSNETIMTHTGPDTEQTDLSAQTVIPGLIDNHMHFVRASKQWYRMVRWDDVSTRAQAIEMIKERAAQLPEGEWLLVIGGFVFDQFTDNSEVFTLAELDEVLPDRPLYIQEAYRRGFANSAALAAAGISDEADSSGSSATGELTGRAAVNLMNSLFPDVADDTWDQSLRHTIDSLLGMGLTAVYDIGGNTVTPAFYDSVGRVADADQLKMRVFYSLNEQNSASNSAEEIMMEMRNNTPDLQGLRFAQFGYGETVYRPMRANPFVVSEEDREHFRNIAITAIENGWQLHEHSNQDVKVQAMLSILENVADTNPAMRDMRFTIAHTNGLSRESVEKAIGLDMVFAVHSSRRQMSRTAFENGAVQPPARTINELGGMWGLGSDSTTVGSPNPFHTLGWVVSGRSISGNVYLQETVSREAALTAHTRNNAYILFRENDLGSLEPGKLADFAVLSDDYMAVTAEEIEDLRSVMTVVEGEVDYSDD
jgi:predicted amidohydrolase YtcJ